MEGGQNGNTSSGSSLNPNNNSDNNSNEIKGKGPKAKSCKGCLYYSKSQQPTCVGIPRTLENVPYYLAGESETEVFKKGSGLADFKYVCAGYSVFLEKNGQSTDLQDKPAEFPVCFGFVALQYKKTATAEQVLAYAHKNEDNNHTLPQLHPLHSAGDDCFTRFKRNAGLVASGVARTVNKVGNHVKETVYDTLDPHRRRPK